MKKRPKAYVSGGSGTLYTLNIPVSDPAYAEFVELDAIQFTIFKAAQELATTINQVATKHIRPRIERQQVSYGGTD